MLRELPQRATSKSVGERRMSSKLVRLRGARRGDYGGRGTATLLDDDARGDE